MSNQPTLSTSREPTLRPATVDDMINWLRLDGFYRGLVGWSTQFSPEEIFGSRDQLPTPPEFGQDSSQKSANTRAPQRDLDLNAALQQASCDAEEEKYVRRMVEQHKKLIPAAVREVEKRLMDAGVPMEEVQKSGKSGTASSVYAKLQRLEQTQRPAPPPPRVRIQVVCDIGGMDDKKGAWKLDLYIPRNCMFEEFEDILNRHAYVRGILEAQRLKTPERNNDAYSLDEKLNGTIYKKKTAPVLRDKYVRDKVWGYRIVSKEANDIPVENDGHWFALCDQADFTKLMKVVVRDASKVAVICHETTLETPPPPPPSPPPQWKDVDMKDIYELWKGWENGTFDREPIDWDTNDWEMDGHRPIGDDFDWSKVHNGTILQEQDDSSKNKNLEPQGKDDLEA